MTQSTSDTAPLSATPPAAPPPAAPPTYATQPPAPASRRRFERHELRSAAISAVAAALVVLVASAGFAVGRATAPDDRGPVTIQRGDQDNPGDQSNPGNQGGPFGRNGGGPQGFGQQGGSQG